MSRKNLLLLVVLLVQAALVFYTLMPEKQTGCQGKNLCHRHCQGRNHRPDHR